MLFLFPGQASHFEGMAEELYRRDSIFREWMSRLDQVVQPITGRSVVASLYDGDRARTTNKLVITHPAIYMVEVALVRSLAARGITPTACLGSSLGEFAAWVTADALDPLDGAELVARQAVMIEKLCPAGGMLAALAAPEDIVVHHGTVLAQSQISIADQLGPKHVVIAGSFEAVAGVRAALVTKTVPAVDLDVGFGFHSPAIDAAREPWLGTCHMVRLRPPRLALFSAGTRGPITRPEIGMLWHAVREPMRSLEALRAAHQHSGSGLCVDVGPSAAMAALATRALGTERAFSVITRFGSEVDRIAALREKQQPKGGFMKACVFPGQGSQYRGMGSELFTQYPALVSIADETLGYSISELCKHDPQNELINTRFTQPALYVVGALAWQKHLEDGTRGSALPAMLAGHSLGEYVALLAAGAFDFETGLRLVRRRGELMAEAQPGGMAAVLGLDAQQILETLTNEGVSELDLANDNAPGQVVLSGPRADIARAQPFFERAGARYIILPVGGAFHSRYMSPAQRSFAAYLQGFSFDELRIPVISNVEAAPYTRDRIADLLARQLTAPVRWTESVRYMLRSGIEEIQELGPGKVLQKLVATIRKATPEQHADRAHVPAAPSAVVEANTSAASAAPTRVSAETASAAESSAKRAPLSVRRPEALGSAAFREAHGVRYAYVAGGMARGVSSVQAVTRMARSGMLAFYGASGLTLAEVQQALAELRRSLGTGSAFGLSLSHGAWNADRDEQIVEACLAHGVERIEACDYLQLPPALVLYRVRGATRDARGEVSSRHHILARLSRPELAALYCAPPPDRIVRKLVAEGRIDEEQAALAPKLTMADDICIGSDAWSQGEGAAHILLPTIRELCGRAAASHGLVSPRLGLGTGIGTPFAAASAFLAGADFISTVSINLATVESSVSDVAKDMLVQLDVQDTELIPSGDLFELGGRVRVMRKGVLFPARASKLFELYRRYERLSDIDVKTLRQIEDRYFRRAVADISKEVCTRTLMDATPPEHRQKREMSLVFRWYFDQGLQAAMRGDADRRVDFQLQCGPALGAFNRWAVGGARENWRARNIDEMARALMEGASASAAAQIRAVTI